MNRDTLPTPRHDYPWSFLLVEEKPGGFELRPHLRTPLNGSAPYRSERDRPRTNVRFIGSTRFRFADHAPTSFTDCLLAGNQTPYGGRTMNATKTLLSVDWDFFFPNPFDGARMPGENLLLWDWNKRETPFHTETIWLPLRCVGPAVARSSV